MLPDDFDKLADAMNKASVEVTETYPDERPYKALTTVIGTV